ncbi:hypothetical protein [Amycolatopsis sp. FDAARGOS 1241]|uniref:hypothetical protein n=1 Tax=Amycolatopsis sp. FDAARGOS 1241 TaxID=2778070 RepID=UPI001EF22BF4|nr:hypothetical protein [Amycolatopsis sp. FDAARGOS 1241]
MAFDPVVFESAKTVTDSLPNGTGDHGPATTSGAFKSPGDQTPPDGHDQWIPQGTVTTPPPVPGGSDHPGKGVTTVNTEAMKVWAKNMQTLADGPIKDLPNQLDGITVKPGIFATAQNKIINPIVGSGGVRDKVRSAIQDLIPAMHDAAEAANKAAKDYEDRDEFNNMEADKYKTYFGTVDNEINNAGNSKS